MNRFPLKSALKLNINDWLQIIQAILLLIIANFLIFLTPLRWWYSWMGVKNGVHEKKVSPEKIRSTDRVRHNVRRANRILFNTSKCFAHSIALKKMLDFRRLPSTLHLGFSKDPQNKMSAHAWVKQGSRIIYGGRFAEQQYTALVCFV